jgi:hypothetical protein
MEAEMAWPTVCPKCGAEYEITEVKYAVRDNDNFECECGYEMASWSQSRVPEYRLIKHGKSRNA